MKNVLTAVLFAAACFLAVPYAAYADDETITFTDEDVTVPPIVKTRINEYSNLVIQQDRNLLTSLQSALNNFETTMSFAPLADANPDLFKAMASAAFKEGLHMLSLEVPGLNLVYKALLGAADEMERAARASESHTVGEWIRNQRSAIDTQLRDTTTRNQREAIKMELELAYLAKDTAGRDSFFALLHRGIERMSGNVGPSIDNMEISLYEKWINANRGVRHYDSLGMVEYKIRLNEDNGSTEVESVHVVGPYGSHIDGTLNPLFRRVASPNRPIDLKVHKRVCVYCTNLVGGKGWSCGWLDARNNVMTQPIMAPAQRVMASDEWRTKRSFTIGD